MQSAMFKNKKVKRLMKILLKNGKKQVKIA
jgi:hypothetical protein